MLIDKLSSLGDISRLKFEQKLVEASMDITGKEAQLLAIVDNDPQRLTPSKMAEIVGVNKASISRHVSNMLDKDLIKKGEGSEGRSYNILLTPKGENYVNLVNKAKSSLDTELSDKLSKLELETLIKLLNKLID